ncbi:PAS domain-containing protein, partial [Methylobacterium sp. WL7]|uniref:PAS domain-containing protein n=1 Tax=Methylobacterium sp. WL7 TaxID=2603900 RepID=UPI0011C84A16
AGEFKRIGKDGREIWLQATYNPILDRRGKPIKVVKFAADVTAAVLERRRRADLQSALARDLTAIAEAASGVSQQAGQAA